MGRQKEALALAAEAKADPALASPYEIEGLLADHDNRPAEAAAAFAKAADMKSTNYYAYYRAAEGAGLAPDARVRLLEQAVALNGQFIYAYEALANALGSNPTKAVDVLIKAVQVDPQDLDLRVRLANILLQLSRWNDAATVGRGAVPMAVTQEERQTVQRILDVAARGASLPSRGAPPPGRAQ
jgi:tetratricopeptide (TPR) repeat protein